MSVSWHGDDYKKHLKALMAQRLERACIVVENEAKQLVSEPSNHGTTPAAAGDPPHKDTGRLRASISHEVDAENQTGRVGTNVDYAKYQELGTRNMPAHPFLRPALANTQVQVRRIIDGK